MTKFKATIELEITVCFESNDQASAEELAKELASNIMTTFSLYDKSRIRDWDLNFSEVQDVKPI